MSTVQQLQKPLANMTSIQHPAKARHYRYNSIVNVGSRRPPDSTVKNSPQLLTRAPHGTAPNDDQMTIQLTPEGRQDHTPHDRRHSKC